MVGRCGGAQGLGGPYHRGGEVNREHDGIYIICVYITNITINVYIYIWASFYTERPWQDLLNQLSSLQQQCPVAEEIQTQMADLWEEVRAFIGSPSKYPF